MSRTHGLARTALLTIPLVPCLLVSSASEARAQAPPSGPIAVWHADSSPADAVGGNALTFTGTYTLGQFGKAFAFNGTNLAKGGAGLNVQSAFTVSAWVNFQGMAATNTTNNAPIVAKWGDTGLGTAGYGIFVFNGGVSATLASNDGVSVGSVSGGSLPSGQWKHVAGTYDGSWLWIYMGGVPVVSTPFSGTIKATSAPVVVGGYDPAFTNVRANIIGAIDEAMIFDRALSGTEIAAFAAPTVFAEKKSGDHQVGLAGHTLPKPFVVRVRAGTAFIPGASIPNMPVTFTVVREPRRAKGTKLDSGALTKNAATDTNGDAQATLTWGNQDGLYVVEANVAGTVLRFETGPFHLSAEPDPPSGAARDDIGINEA